MNSVLFQVVLYGIVAGASPIALGSTLVVLGSRGGRWNGLAFAAGVVLSQLVMCGVAAAVGSATLPIGDDPHDAARAVMELALGLALLVVGGVVWSRPTTVAPKANPRSTAVFDRLGSLNAASLFIAGAVLALGPKRLALTLLVTATISTASLGATEAAALTAGYVVLATALVTAPALLAALVGARASAWMTDGQQWLTAHRRPLTCYPVTILGTLAFLDGLVGLLR